MARGVTPSRVLRSTAIMMSWQTTVRGATSGAAPDFGPIYYVNEWSATA